MVDTQLRARGISDERILEAFLRVPRHGFVPEGAEDAAYEDRPVPIGEGQTISQPYIVALMIELCEVGPEDRLLEIGTGSGYVAALLAELCESVYTVERSEQLCRNASVRLRSMGYEEVKCLEGDGYEGYETAAPYDGIILSAAPEKIPESLLFQLREGGRLVAPVGRGSQYLEKVRRRGDEFERSRHGGVRFVPMLPGTERR